MKNLVILSSGQGTNLQNIIDKIENKTLFNCKISLIISNNDSVSLKTGININTPTLYYPWDKHSSTRENYDYKLAQIISPFNPDLIVLSGWNHILTAAFLDVFKGNPKIINLHPALINTFPGNNAIYDAWDAGQRGQAKETGIMVHTVTTELDVGEVIEEIIIPIDTSLSLQQLETIMKNKEKQVLINAINKLTTNLIYQGKVKDVYELEGNRLLISHTDRLSACDSYVCDIPNKGYYLCKIASWWFNKTREIIQNHMIESNENCLLVNKCEVIPIEFIIRGYICGSLWKHYNSGHREYCGVKLEDGLTQFQKLPEFIITPTTKDIIDIPISYNEIINKEILTKEKLDYIYDLCYKLFVYGTYECNKHNLILVDTKYEFGYTKTGEIILVDEIHTVESSRFWIKYKYKDCIKNNMEPEKIDKDIIRKYVKNNMEIPSDVITKYINIYKNFYSKISNNEEITSLPAKEIKINEIYTSYNTIDYNIVIISGSIKDEKHVNKIKTNLDKFNLKYNSYVCSAHKNTAKVLEILNNNLNKCRIYITVAGKSNALSGVVASNSKVPVIACPPFKDNVDMMTNLQSSIQCPSNCPVMTILDPQNVAESCNRILGCN